VRAEAAVEPVERQVPALARPAEVRDVAAAVRSLPDGRGKDEQVGTERRRDFVLVVEEEFCILLTIVGIELEASATHHLLAVDEAFATLEEGDALEIGGRCYAARCVLEKFPALFAHIALEGWITHHEIALDPALEECFQRIRIVGIATPLPKLALDLEELAIQLVVEIACDVVRHDNLPFLVAGPIMLSHPCET